MGLLTRKQQWRRTRTRNKRSWGDLPPEVLEAMLGGGANMSKSVSWDQSFAAALRARAEQSRAEAIRVAAAAVATGSAAAAARGGQQGEGRKGAMVNTRHAGAGSVQDQHIPRSVSCSSLEARRTLFPRSSSRDELGVAGKPGAGVRRGSDGRRGVLHRRGVSFDTQVRMKSVVVSYHISTGFINHLVCVFSCEVFVVVCFEKIIHWRPVGQHAMKAKRDGINS